MLGVLVWDGLPLAGRAGAILNLIVTGREAGGTVRSPIYGQGGRVGGSAGGGLWGIKDAVDFYCVLVARVERALVIPFIVKAGRQTDALVVIEEESSQTGQVYERCRAAGLPVGCGAGRSTSGRSGRPVPTGWPRSARCPTGGARAGYSARCRPCPSCPGLAGMAPLSWLFLRSKCFRLLRLPRLAGIGPLS